VQIFSDAPAEHKQAVVTEPPQLTAGKGIFSLPLLAAARPAE
jgi:hypothetical protein